MKLFCKKVKLKKYKSKLYVDCANLLIKNGFKQTGDYVFIKENNGYRVFCLYHFFTDGLTLNIYYPQEPSKLITSIDEMQEQIDRFKNEQKI